MDGNLGREGITADFEALQRVGIGGVLFMEVDVGIPKGPVKFMSLPWRELFKHANAEAARLGLVMTMPASPGWTGSGGPWVKPEQSMQKVVFSETNLVGPTTIQLQLPQPPTIAGYYREVAVLAFPTPSQPYQIADIAEKALYHRGHFSSEPGVKPLLGGMAIYLVLSADQVIPSSQIVDLTSQLDTAGQLRWDMPPGPWTILRFGHTSTGANTRPAPEPGIGLECDKLDRAALEAHFQEFLGKLLADIGPLAGKSLVSLHIDSWEMGPQNWTGRFRAEFQQRRGYDLLPYLPVLTGRAVESLEISERFLWDLRQTVLELIAENHSGWLAELAHRHGLGLSIEPYDGTPCDDMTYGARADVPMGELWRDTFRTWFSCTEASSIAHTYGRPIVQAEAFTSGDRERWLAHPASLKALGDWAFCEGINRLVFHRSAHQPWLERAPGMTMGPYGIHYERTQTWFEQSKGWIDYLSRCQALLQQGLFVADVAFLKPEASPQVFRPPSSATRGEPPDRLGYNFDALNPEVLLTRVQVKDHQLVLPDGMRYRLLVLPQTETMTPELLRKVRDLLRAGATVLGAPPLKSPSLRDYPQCDAQLKELVLELWGSAPGKDLQQRTVGEGLLFSALPQKTAPEPYGDFALVSAVLAQLGVPPDFEGDGPLRYIHRRLDDTDIYFVANSSDDWLQSQCAFRVAGKTPEIWDPLTGQQTAALGVQESNGRTFLPLALEPTGSRFIVFRRTPAADPAAERAHVMTMQREGASVLPLMGHALHTVPVVEPMATESQALLVWQPGRYEGTTSAGTLTTFQADRIPAPQTIIGPWQVRFQAGRGAPESLRLDELVDLSKHSDPGIKYFSGKAVYSATFSRPTHALGPDQRLFLDLGRVEVMATVILNGHDLGIVWKQPFRVEVTRQIRPGENRLEIQVANLWPNRLIGDLSLPPDRRIAFTTWNPFHKDSPLPPSGLLGPVTLRSAQVLPISPRRETGE